MPSSESRARDTPPPPPLHRPPPLQSAGEVSTRTLTLYPDCCLCLLILLVPNEGYKHHVQSHLRKESGVVSIPSPKMCVSPFTNCHLSLSDSSEVFRDPAKSPSLSLLQLSSLAFVVAAVFPFTSLSGVPQGL